MYKIIIFHKKFQMPIVKIPTSFNISLEFDTPGLGRRLASLFFDMLIQYAYIYLIIELHSSVFQAQWQNSWAIWLILLSPVFVYHIFSEVALNGQSLGKKIMKLRVVNLNGGRPSISQFLIRWLLRVSDLWIVILLFLLISFMGGQGNTETIIAVLFGFGFLITDIILVSNSSKGQRIGDVLAQTILIKINRAETLNSTIFREVEKEYVPAFPQVMRISDRDLNIIKTLINNGNEKQNSRH